MAVTALHEVKDFDFDICDLDAMKPGENARQ